MMLTYREKLEQANCEALATVVGLVVTIAVWAACGFGLAGLDVQVFHTPLWVVGGTLGTWACAIAVSAVLARRVFADFDLDDESALKGTVPFNAAASESSNPDPVSDGADCSKVGQITPGVFCPTCETKHPWGNLSHRMRGLPSEAFVRLRPNAAGEGDHE